MRATTLVLALLGAAAASPVLYPNHGSKHLPSCSKASGQPTAGSQPTGGSQPTVVNWCTTSCSYYRVATVTTTTTVLTATTSTSTATVPSTVLITSCAVPSTSSAATSTSVAASSSASASASASAVIPKKKRTASPPSSPQTLSSYPSEPNAPTTCKCPNPGNSTTTTTVTSTSFTSTATTVTTVTTGTTAINAIQTFAIYETGATREGPAYLDIIDYPDKAGEIAELSLTGSVLTTYTLTINGSLVVANTGGAALSSATGYIAVESPSESYDPNRVVFLDAADVAASTNASLVTCTIATDSDGTCPLTCQVNGKTLPYETVTGLVDIGATVPSGGSAITLYVVGSAAAAVSSVAAAVSAAATSAAATDVVRKLSAVATSRV